MLSQQKKFIIKVHLAHALYSIQPLCVRDKDKLLVLKSHSKRYLQKTRCVFRQDIMNG